MTAFAAGNSCFISSPVQKLQKATLFAIVCRFTAFAAFATGFMISSWNSARGDVNIPVIDQGYRGLVQSGSIATNWAFIFLSFLFVFTGSTVRHILYIKMQGDFCFLRIRKCPDRCLLSLRLLNHHNLSYFVNSRTCDFYKVKAPCNRVSGTVCSVPAVGVGTLIYTGSCKGFYQVPVQGKNLYRKVPWLWTSKARKNLPWKVQKDL